MKTLALLVAAGLLATRPIHAQEPTKFEVGTHGGATILLPDGGDAEFVVGVPGAGTALGLFPPILSAGDHRVVWPCSASREYWPSIEKGQPAAGAGQMGVRTFRQQRRPPGFRGTSRRAALRPARNWRTAAPGVATGSRRSRQIVRSGLASNCRAEGLSYLACGDLTASRLAAPAAVAPP
jgi:hypothetical protein